MTGLVLVASEWLVLIAGNWFILTGVDYLVLTGFLYVDHLSGVLVCIERIVRIVFLPLTIIRPISLDSVVQSFGTTIL